MEVSSVKELGHSLLSVEMLGKTGVAGPASLRLLNLSIYMYIHIHELSDPEPVAVHLVLLQKLNFSPPPGS